MSASSIYNTNTRLVHRTQITEEVLGSEVEPCWQVMIQPLVGVVRMPYWVTVKTVDRAWGTIQTEEQGTVHIDPARKYVVRYYVRTENIGGAA